MSNAFDDVRAAVSAAEFQLGAADSVATNLAVLLRGRLRHVSRPDVLIALKRELRDFDMHTRQWKEPGK